MPPSRSRRLVGPPNWRPPEELRRTLYILAIALGLVVVLFLNVLTYRSGDVNLYVQVVLPVTMIPALISLGWLLRDGPLDVPERLMFFTVNVQVFAQALLEEMQRTAPAGETDLLYWSVVVNVMLGYLIFPNRVAGWYSAGLFGFSAGLPWLGVALRGSVVSPDLPRLQLTVGIVLLFVHALSWYRGQFEAQRSAVRVMQRLAHTDLLTNLPNRRGMYPAVEALLASGGGALLLDLDHFKRVNDTFGHQVGDEVLERAARLLEAQVPPGGRVGRWGGEEFLMTLPGLDAPAAGALAEAVCRAFRTQTMVDVGVVTISAGLTLTRPGDTLPILVARADEHLYAAKRAGRDGWADRMAADGSGAAGSGPAFPDV
ncbi:GGDEF domain-containing protein [Deinococcus kurensis]|uniref:GGDEF domain-containing protein n=1 Tax=Deinococcus kurensis TaxID=2662757 RepID=UPI0012D2F9AD|nr:GGDEF domain-containing protein [Deinococcus kurensis]